MSTFATNVKVFDSPFPIEHIDNLEDLDYWASTVYGRKIFLLDEAGRTMRRRTPMSSLNVKWLDDMQILRKYKLSIIFVTPHEKYMDSGALGSDILDAVIVKPNFKNPKIALYKDILEDFGLSLYDVPRTKVNFDTWDTATFKKNSVKRKPKFKTKELQNLWDWSHGGTYKTLGIHPQTLNRITRKFIKEALERDFHSSQNIGIEVNASKIAHEKPK